jgi:hypothetical protein
MSIIFDRSTIYNLSVKCENSEKQCAKKVYALYAQDRIVIGV